MCDVSVINCLSEVAASACMMQVREHQQRWGAACRRRDERLNNRLICSLVPVTLHSTLGFETRSSATAETARDAYVGAHSVSSPSSPKPSILSLSVLSDVFGAVDKTSSSFSAHGKIGISSSSSSSKHRWHE